MSRSATPPRGSRPAELKESTGPPGTAPLLRTGVRLSERYSKALPQVGIGSVWIEDDLGRDIDVVEPLTPETRERVHRATGDALDSPRRAPAAR